MTKNYESGGSPALVKNLRQFTFFDTIRVGLDCSFLYLYWIVFFAYEYSISILCIFVNNILMTSLALSRVRKVF